ncbi:MAG: M23 family metallopeptidase [Mariprofundus sp.]|nr:M23 family metallopeptidase [Mariprofundus sp.]
MKNSVMIAPFCSGRLVGFVVERKILLLSLLMLFALLLFGSWGMYASWQRTELQSELNSRAELLQQLLAQEKSNQRKLQAEQNKSLVYARALGHMQARMIRLDALGSRLVDVASLDKAEFNFDMEPALGGLNQSNMPIDSTALQQGVMQVDGRMQRMDAQLTAVGYMLESKRSRADAKPHSWPTIGGWISSRYGPRLDPFSGARRMHYGLDIANKKGAPVLASSAGVVVFASKMVDFGYVVDVDHGYGYSTRSAHMASINVKVGDVVKNRDKLGEVGSTGHSTGPHIHFELRHKGKLIDPSKFIHKS